MTQVGLGAVEPLASLPSGTLVGIPAVSSPELVIPAASEPMLLPVREPAPNEALPAEASRAEPLPRFDDNPLISAFPPPRPSPRLSTPFSGFVPLGSPTRSFTEPVPVRSSEPELEAPIERGPPRTDLPHRSARARAAGQLAIGLGVAASFGLALLAAFRWQRSEPEVVAFATSEARRPLSVPPAAAPTALVPAAAAPAEPAPGASASPLTPAPPPLVGSAEIPSEPESPSAPPRAPASPPAAAASDPETPTDEESEPALAEVPEAAAASGPSRDESAGEGPAALDTDPALDAPALDDEHLAQLFALETRSEAYRCAVRASSAPPAAEATSSQALWQGWRRAQQSGDVDGALLALCELRRSHASNIRLYQELASLALRWGDAAGAREASEAGLALAPRDTALLLLRGDATALLGELAASRSAWLTSFGSDSARREPKLADVFAGRGKTALERSDFAKARTYFRRAAVLSQGALEASVGMGRALAGLGESRAALAWARRSAILSPRDADLQMSYGDALYWAGDPAAARRTWSAAAALDISPAIRRRLAKGHP